MRQNRKRSVSGAVARIKFADSRANSDVRSISIHYAHKAALHNPTPQEV